MKKQIFVLFGPPGSGKGAQATMLFEAYNLVHISTGDISRKIARQDTELGLRIKSIIDPGNFLPDEMMIEMLIEFISEQDCTKGLIFDGFPRTLPQAELFDKFLSEKFPDAIVHYVELIVEESECIYRLAARAAGEGRVDDSNPEVIQHRFNIFKQKTLPVIERYRKNSCYRFVVGTGKNAPEVFTQVKEIFVGCVVHESTS